MLGPVIWGPGASEAIFITMSSIFTVHGTVHCYICVLHNQRDATYTTFFIIISALHVSGGFSAHRQELIKLYVQPWVLSCFPAIYLWCGCVGTVQLQLNSANTSTPL
jgi:hypothetical protein